MQKKLLRIIFMVLITVLFVLTVKVKATNDTSLEDLIVGDSVSQTVTDPVVGENNIEEENIENGTVEDVDNKVNSSVEKEPSVGSTAADANSTSSQSTQTQPTYGTPYTGQKTSQPTTSYSTIATIPEANLSLNNILNVILIAVGVIIILLAIAILIRLK